MGFNRRKLDAEQRHAAEKKAAEQRATDAQVLEDAQLFSPTIGAAIAAGYWFLWVRCPACRTINAIRSRACRRAQRGCRHRPQRLRRNSGLRF
jgi:phage FluMu protein Com